MTSARRQQHVLGRGCFHCTIVSRVRMQLLRLKETRLVTGARAAGSGVTSSVMLYAPDTAKLHRHVGLGSVSTHILSPRPGLLKRGPGGGEGCLPTTQVCIPP